MNVRPSRASLIIWVLASVVAVLSCSLYLSAARLDGEYLPVGNDSFYHARRILDTAQDTSAFFEFDPKIHAPEGSLLVWPWGYDFFMAQVVRAGTALGLSDQPIEILIWLPVAAVLISVALIILLARSIGLSHWTTAMAAAAFALSPTTQFLHGAGLIDHHFAEMIFVLAALVAGLRWLREPDSVRKGVLVGFVLGLAPAVHNGLFVLQIPLLTTLLVWWIQGRGLSRQPSSAFAATLLITITAILLPSTAFREGRFEFYTLSWFHFYVTACTALVTFALSRFEHTARSTAGLVVGGLALTIPIWGQVVMAQSFVAGTFKWLENIAEMKSPVFEAFQPGSAKLISALYSYLFWIAPVTLLLCAFNAWRERESYRLLFWVSSIAGLLLLSSQIRMHYFGDFALYFPWLLLASEQAARRPHLARKIQLGTTLALLLMFAPSIRQLVLPMPIANDMSFKDTRSVLATLAKACKEDPGIVLADNNAGHYVRYFTECSVMVNNFLLTPQHFRKMDEVERLFSLPAGELKTSAPLVKYVLVRPLDIRRNAGQGAGYKYWFFFPGEQPLVTDLLLKPEDQVPPGFKLLNKVLFGDSDNIPFAALYKVEDSAAVPHASPNDSKE